MKRTHRENPGQIGETREKDRKGQKKDEQGQKNEKKKRKMWKKKWEKKKETKKGKKDPKDQKDKEKGQVQIRKTLWLKPPPSTGPWSIEPNLWMPHRILTWTSRTFKGEGLGKHRQFFLWAELFLGGQLSTLYLCNVNGRSPILPALANFRLEFANFFAKIHARLQHANSDTLVLYLVNNTKGGSKPKLAVAGSVVQFWGWRVAAHSARHSTSLCCWWTADLLDLQISDSRLQTTLRFLFHAQTQTSKTICFSNFGFQDIQYLQILNGSRELARGQRGRRRRGTAREDGSSQTILGHPLWETFRFEEATCQNLRGN